MVTVWECARYCDLCLLQCVQPHVSAQVVNKAKAGEPVFQAGSGPFLWLTYKEVEAEILNIGAGLLELGVKRGDRIGICGPNRPEWTLASLATQAEVSP